MIRISAALAAMALLAACVSPDVSQDANRAAPVDDRANLRISIPNVIN